MASYQQAKPTGTMRTRKVPRTSAKTSAPSGKIMTDPNGKKLEPERSSVKNQTRKLAINQETREIETLKRKIEIMYDKIKWKNETLKILAEERNFYFSKCRDVEILCMPPFGPEGHPSSNQVLGIIHATAKGFMTPDETQE